MRKVRADLHLHTCLSPCADDRMQATAIVEQAKKMDLDMIGICDHNSAENVLAVLKAGRREGIEVIAGIEITCREEAHILGLFDEATALMEMQEVVYANLPGKYYDESFGPQILIDEWDRVVGANHRLLIGATTLTVEQVVEAVHRHSGIAIASHVDRERFSLIGQLGFIPEGLSLDAVEVARPSDMQQEYDYPVVTSSDAHFLQDIGTNYTSFTLEEPSLNEIRKALRHEMGRSYALN